MIRVMNQSMNSERDLFNHFKGDQEKESPVKTEPAVEPHRVKVPPKKSSAAGMATAGTADDYQLSRALEMLKGLNVFSTMTNGKSAPQPVPATPAETSK